MNALRQKLRLETTEAHRRLDNALIEHDLTTRLGLADYLTVHYLARVHLKDALADNTMLPDEAEKLSTLLSDLEALDISEPRWEKRPLPYENHPLGLTYVIAGSSLGSKLLYKNWLATSDPLVQKAGKFMTSAKNSDAWTHFLKQTDQVDYDDDELAPIINAANGCFGIFEAANEQIIRSR